MFGRVIFFAIVCVALALLGSSFLLDRLPAPGAASAARATDSHCGRGARAGAASSANRSGYREALLEADQRGQYAAGVLINGTPVRMLIDTGASEVCVSASTAEAVGT